MGQLLKGETWQGARFRVGNPELNDTVAKVRAINPSLLTHANVQGLRPQTLLWAGSTGGATALDLADKAGLTESPVNLKNSLTREVGA